MSNEKHTTAIEVTANTGGAEAAVERLLAKLNKANDAADLGNAGWGGGGSPSSFTPGSATQSTAGGGRRKRGGGGVPYGPARPEAGPGNEKWARIEEKAEWDRRIGAAGGPGATKSTAASAANDDWQSTISRARGGGLLSAMSVGGFGGGVAGGLSGVATAGQLGMMGMGGPAGPFAALGRGATLGAQYIKQQAAASGMKPGGLGRAGIGGLAIAAALAAAGGMGVSARLRAAGERAGLEPLEMQAMLASTPAHAGAHGKFGSAKHNYMKFADEWGAAPQDVAAMMAQTATGIGSPGLGYNATAHFSSQMFGAKMMGLDPGAFIGYAKTLAPGGGARSGLQGEWSNLDTQTKKLLGFTQGMGLSGSRANEAMNAITGIISGRAGAGMMTNDTDLMGFGIGLKQTGIAQVQGLGATRAMARTMQAGTSAGQAFGGVFSGLEQAALWGSAMQGGPGEGAARSPQEMMRRLNAMDSPGKIRDALVKMLGPEGAELALYGRGESAATAKGILGARTLSAPDGTFPTQDAVDKGLAVTKANARKSARVQEMTDTQQSVRLIEFLDATQQHILDFAKPGGIADKILTGITALARAAGAQP